MSTSRASRISYHNDDKRRFQLNVDRLLNIKSYLSDQEKKPTIGLPEIDHSQHKAIFNKTHIDTPDTHASKRTGKNQQHPLNKTPLKLPPIKMSKHGTV